MFARGIEHAMYLYLHSEYAEVVTAIEEWKLCTVCYKIDIGLACRNLHFYCQMQRVIISIQNIVDKTNLLF